MMKRRWLRAGIGLAVPVVLALGAFGAWAAFAPHYSPIPQDIDSTTRIDANKIDMYVMNTGGFAHDRETGNSGLIYPKGTTKTAIFAAGIWVGAQVNGATRVSVGEYSWDYSPGKIISPTEWDDREDPRLRVYKIDKDSEENQDTDWLEWPVADGAPVDTAGKPLLTGDQTLWCVYNDLNDVVDRNNASSTTPLGVEVQQTTFAFDRQGALGEVVFLVFKIINKGGNTLEDMYVSIWSDPDVGGASDDLVGSDTTLSLGYSYNATNSDNLYGSTPPAAGFDFFQGPIVPSPGDTAYVSGRPVPDYRNLPMTSFNKYINGTDPESSSDTYNYMQGLNADGSVVIDPITGLETKFVAPGDPVTATGWIDSNPADRRMMLNSGPFVMAPGDTQEVVTAVVLGQGKDRLTAITAMKFNDLFAQAAFDANFDLPSPPPSPRVDVAELDRRITLYWGTQSETQYEEEGYEFEGYNIYMGESVAGPWQRIATYDINNNIGIIFDDQFDIETGVVVNKPVQFGADTGITHTLSVTTDFIRGGFLSNNKTYYFAVTAYAYNPDGVAGLKTLENSIQPLAVIPQKAAGGVNSPSGASGDTLAVYPVGTAGDSDAAVYPILVDPQALTGDAYTVEFGEDDDGLYWNLYTEDGPLLEMQRNVSGDANYLVVDGILWKVLGAPAGFKQNDRPNPMVDETFSTGGVEVPPDTHGGPGNDVFHSLNSTGEWYLSAGGGDGSAGRFLRSETNNDFRDIVMYWGDAPDGLENIGWWAFDNEEVGPVPFSLFHRNPFTGEETRLVAILYSGDDVPESTPGVYDFADPETYTDAYFGYPATDWTYAYTLAEGFTYEDFVADAQDGVIDNDPTDYELFARLVVGGFTYDPDAGVDPMLPGDGTVIFFSTTKPPQPGDKFEVPTEALTSTETSIANSLKNIRVVPNPYFAHSAYELNQFERVVKFTQLPQECTIRIFNIAGDLVRTLTKERSHGSSLEWDLLTEQRLPVASGVYIYHVDAKEGGRSVGTTYGRMAVFIEKERLNTF